MKLITTATLIASLSVTGAAFAQSGEMGGMKMTDKDMMKDTDKKGDSKAAVSASHQADAEVKDVDVAQGKVTLAHGPVKSLGWPAMNMAFAVKDKALFDKLVVGQKVHVEFKKEDTGYVVTSVK